MSSEEKEKKDEVIEEKVTEEKEERKDPVVKEIEEFGEMSFSDQVWHILKKNLKAILRFIMIQIGIIVALFLVFAFTFAFDSCTVKTPKKKAPIVVDTDKSPITTFTKEQTQDLAEVEKKEEKQDLASAVANEKAIADLEHENTILKAENKSLRAKREILETSLDFTREEYQNYKVATEELLSTLATYLEGANTFRLNGAI